MTDANEQRLEEIRQRLKKASPGPWRVAWDGERSSIEDVRGSLVAGHLPRYNEDLQLVIHAPEDIRWLLALLDERRA
jgi:hypothetical protein